MRSPDESSRGPGLRDSQVHASADDLALWARAKAVFLEALDRPHSERPTFVRNACGGEVRLLHEVESLLAGDEAASELWETPAAHLLGDEALAAAGLTRPRLQPGAQVGNYQIREFIAAGGMGEVYRAHHVVLRREVAIKTLVGHVSGEAAARRLIREARHTSVLAHPNICAIYEVGQTEDGPFIVMQYVAGRPMNAIVGEAPPPIDVALGYALQIAEALEHAHDHGIVHRDLKSANIVVTPDGRPVVLDFGLARRLPTAAAQSPEATITAQDSLAGTLSHMAPEVLLGGAADERSDIWSLGVLLYELTTGELPFTGRTPYETSSAILGEPPRPMRGRVPLALRLLIERCLSKEPGHRYQRAADVRAALDAIRRRRAWPVIGRLLISVRRRTLIATAATVALGVTIALAGDDLARRFARSASSVSTLAVLPLRNATGDADAAYYADGVTEALTTQLGATSNVRVIAGASASRAAAHGRTAREAGTQLGADAVLEGSVRKADDRVDVEVHLVQPATGRVLWSDRFERRAADVLALEADVVRGLAVAIRLTLRDDARERLATVRAVSPDAYEKYLRGRYEWNKRTPESLHLAIDYFRRAVELDPTYAPAHAALADCYNQLGTVMVGAGSPREFRPRAAAEAIKALQLDPYSAEAHAALGYVYHYDWRWADAERELRRAIELNPNYSFARIWYANLLMSQHRMSDAVHEALVARDLDPFSLIVNTNVGWVLDFAGHHDDAVRQLRQAIELDSSYVQAHWRLADALMHSGRLVDALDEGKRVVAMSGGSAAALGLLAGIYARAHEPDSARAIVASLLARSRNGYVPAWAIAGPLIALGERDAALPWLEKGFVERSNGVAYLTADPTYATMRGDSQYEAIVARVGLK